MGRFRGALTVLAAVVAASPIISAMSTVRTYPIKAKGSDPPWRIGAFLIGWPSIIAVIRNYIKRGEARGAWLDSHFRW